MKSEREHHHSILICELVMGNKMSAPDVAPTRAELDASIGHTAEDVHRIDFYRAALELANLVCVQQDQPKDDVNDRELLAKHVTLLLRLRSIMLTNPNIEMPINVADVVRVFDRKIPDFSRAYRRMVGLPVNR